MKFIPNKEQAKGIKKACKWFRKPDKPTFEISGGAGTGKTTIVRQIISLLELDNNEVLFMAYVGKATLELTKKGNNAKTIHSTIYDLQETVKKDENGNEIRIDGRVITTFKFVKKSSLPKNIKLLVIDEGAMVPENIAKDILSFNIPVIVLGDMNQLPPVFGESYFLQNPDVVLTEPMRFALNSPIVYLANQVLNNEVIRFGKYTDKCYVIDKDMITDKMLLKSDIVICGRNKTRQCLNSKVRNDILHIRNNDPVIGDRIICRKNNWLIEPLQGNIYLINGMIGNIERIDKESYDKQSICIDFLPEFLENDKFVDIRIDYKALTEWKEPLVHVHNKFEYAYAITCHLSQGSEYDNVLIYNERFGDDDFYKKWLYTAITRSKGGLILAF